jgi:hypothetical protein
LLSGSSGSRGPEFNPDNPVVDRRTFRLWGVRKERELCVFDGPFGAVWAVAFSPNGRKAYSAGADWRARLWVLPQ